MIPGALGSSLAADGQPVWIDYRALFDGALGRLAIGSARSRPVELIDRLYGPLLEELARSHAVHTLSYDWRHSIRASASRLLRKLEELLPLAEQHGVPLRMVAHSSGGLVARAMLADAGGRMAWQRWAALPGSRLLMLGTPNAGTHEALRWFTGFNPDRRRDWRCSTRKRGIDGTIELVRRYPGHSPNCCRSERLPAAHDYLDPAFWKSLREQLGAGFAVPQADVLASGPCDLARAGRRIR